MKEEIRNYRMEKYGTITWCEERNTMCFGCLTEDGNCKHEICLHDKPEWREMRRRQDEKRGLTKYSLNGEKEIWQQIREKEAEARQLYLEGKTDEADKLMESARRARAKLKEIDIS